MTLRFTQDLISYKVTGVEPLEVEECAIGDGSFYVFLMREVKIIPGTKMLMTLTGDLCGSVFLDLAFQRYIMTLVGEDKYSAMKETSKKRMMRDFEAGVKRAYAGDPKKEYTVDLKGVEDDEANGICDDTISLKP